MHYVSLATCQDDSTNLAGRQCAINTARTGRCAPVLELADDDRGGAGLLPVSKLARGTGYYCSSMKHADIYVVGVFGGVQAGRVLRDASAGAASTCYDIIKAQVII